MMKKYPRKVWISVLRFQPRFSRALIFISFFTFLSLSFQSVAQVLVTEPGCGTPGSSVLITGSGWAEPIPVCEYIFHFDNNEFASRQPDGLFGPPNRTATIPASATPGEHEIKVELRLISDGTLLQCRKTTFKVVQDIKDPWDGGSNITTSGANINIEFDPTDVCDVTPCDKIVMIQTLRRTGEDTNGTIRTMTAQEIGLPNGAQKDNDTTSSGYVVDYVQGEADPYYNGDDSADGIQQGIQNGMPQSSIISDTPNYPDANFPADIVKAILEFEVGTFCAQGQNKGEFSGSMTWKWEKTKGGTGAATFISASRNPPSSNFIEALNLWNTNHSFTLPTMTPPTTGGMACN